MKIAVVSDYFYPLLGGITENVYNFTKYAIKQGHNVKLITPEPFGYSKDQTAKIDAEYFNKDVVIRLGKHLPIFSNGSLSNLGITLNIDKKLKRLFDKEKFDVVHVHSPLAGFLPMMAIKYSNTLTVGTIHTYFKGNFFFDYFIKHIQKYYDALDGCIAVSESSAMLIKEKLDRTPIVIPNGIDVNLFGATDERIPLFPNDKINVFFIGRADVRNGIDVLIKAFLIAIKKNPKMRLIIAGDGPYMAYYKDMVPADHKKDVFFVGRINKERPVYYNTADIHVFPAEIAAHSITVLEGLAAGKPIITTDIKSFRDVITEGKEGFLVPYGDYEKLSQRILNLADNQDLRKQMGTASRKRSFAFSWEKVTSKIIDFYKDCNSKALKRSI